MAALWLLSVSVALLTVACRGQPVKQGLIPVTNSDWVEKATPGFNQDGYYTIYAPGSGAFANTQPPQGSPRFNVPSGVQLAPSSSSVSVLAGNVPAVAPLGPSVAEGSLGPIMPGPYFPPQPDYQAGQLYQVERSHDVGDHQTETEEASQPFPYRAPPPFFPMSEAASPAMTSMPRPEPFLGGGWGPYPYYDYNFLTGQYPPGTFTYSSNTFEHGRNYWNDVRYRRPSPPYISTRPMQLSQSPVNTW